MSSLKSCVFSCACWRLAPWVWLERTSMGVRNVSRVTFTMKCTLVPPARKAAKGQTVYELLERETEARVGVRGRLRKARFLEFCWSRRGLDSEDGDAGRLSRRRHSRPALSGESARSQMAPWS
jgi:hypothetical protein